VAAVSSVPRGSQIFHRGRDRKVWTIFFDPANLGPVAGGWSNWFPLGGNTFPADAAPAAVSSTERGSQVFVVGSDGKVWTIFFDPANLGPVAGGWSNWFPLGGNTFPVGPIGVVSSVQRGTQLFVLGLDQKVWTIFFDPANLGPVAGGWSNWFPLGDVQFD
jgi:hypothetical protein